MKRLMASLLFLVLLFGCVGEKKPSVQNASSGIAGNASSVQQQANTSQPEEKPSVFTNFSDRDFSIEYPDWDESNYSNFSILALRKGACMLNVDRHNASITPLFNWVVNLTLKNENVTLVDFDASNYSMTVRAPYNNITFKAQYVMRYCNYETYIIGATCAEGFGDENDTARFLSSAGCANVYEEPDYSSAYKLPSLDNTTYSVFTDEDYSAKVPDWDDGKVGQEGVFAFTRNACNVLLNRYNAPSESLFSWIENYISNNSSITLVHKDVPENDIMYDLALENISLRMRMRIVYCNYQSYNLIAMCEKGYYENNSQVLDKILSSADCAKDYSFAPQITDVGSSAPPKEERIAKTDAGLKYGINAESVVKFFNSNPIFVKVMRKYGRVNLRIYDEEEDVDIRLKALLKDGKITDVQDGAYSDAAFTISMPLDDALNVFSNADRITLSNILGFIVNVETDPPGMLKTLIADAFKPG